MFPLSTQQPHVKPGFLDRRSINQENNEQVDGTEKKNTLSPSRSLRSICRKMSPLADGFMKAARDRRSLCIPALAWQQGGCPITQHSLGLSSIQRSHGPQTPLKKNPSQHCERLTQGEQTVPPNFVHMWVKPHSCRHQRGVRCSETAKLRLIPSTHLHFVPLVHSC